MSERDYYKLLYEQSIASASEAKELAKRTLDITLIMVALILALQAYYTFRIRQEEKNSLKAEMRLETSELITASAQRTEAMILAAESRWDMQQVQLSSLLHQSSEQQQKGDVEIACLAKRIVAIWSVIEAKQLYENGSYFMALQKVAGYFKMQIEQGDVDFEVTLFVSNCLTQMKEIDAGSFESIISLIPGMRKAKTHGGIQFIGSGIADVQVYTHNAVGEKIPANKQEILNKYGY